MKDLDINGLIIKFPYEPYQIQVDYMSKIIEGLDKGQNALLESPTGTGKTICLLAATLAWQQAVKDKKRQFEPQGMNHLSTDKAIQEGEMNFLSDFDVVKSIQQSSQVDAPILDFPQIIYCSRTHSQLKQAINQLRSSGLRASNSVLGSRQQLCINKDVVGYNSTEDNSINQGNRVGSSVNQLCQSVVKSQKCKWYNGYENHVKQQNPVSQGIKDIEDLVNQGQSNTQCPYYNSRNYARTSDIVFVPYNYIIDPQISRNTRDIINWKNSILIFDEGHNLQGVCQEAASFDLPLRLVEKCQQDILAGLKISTDKEWVQRHYKDRKLLDKAQNNKRSTSIEDVEQKNTDLVNLSQVLQNLLKACHQCLVANNNQAKAYPSQRLFQIFNSLNIRKETLTRTLMSLDYCQQILIEKAREDTSKSAARNAGLSCQRISEIFEIAFESVSSNLQLPNGVGIGQSQYQAVQGNDMFRMYLQYQTQGANPQYGGQNRQQYGNNFNNRSNNKSMTNAAAAGSNQVQQNAGNFVSEDFIQHCILSYWCFSPDIAMRKIQNQGVRSIIVTSGTLAPFEGVKSELVIPFNIELANQHIIRKEQVNVTILKKGPMGVALNSSFQTRSNEAYLQDLGLMVVNVARVVPDGILVFFPSYVMMEKCINFWKAPIKNAQLANQKLGYFSIWEGISQSKPAVIEPKESHLFQNALNDYLNKVEMGQGQGAVLFAVCRGKVSEGIDFSDRAGRCVIIMGIPFAQKYDPKVELKQSILNERTVGNQQQTYGNKKLGDFWYSQQGIRAVNQAVGRVIRHKDDFGLVILADERFQYYRKMLSKWVQQFIQEQDKYSNLQRLVEQFFSSTRLYQMQNSTGGFNQFKQQSNGQLPNGPNGAPQGHQIQYKGIFTNYGTKQETLDTLATAFDARGIIQPLKNTAQNETQNKSQNIQQPQQVSNSGMGGNQSVKNSKQGNRSNQQSSVLFGILNDKGNGNDVKDVRSNQTNEKMNENLKASLKSQIQVDQISDEDMQLYNALKDYGYDDKNRTQDSNNQSLNSKQNISNINIGSRQFKVSNDALNLDSGSNIISTGDKQSQQIQNISSKQDQEQPDGTLFQRLQAKRVIEEDKDQPNKKIKNQSQVQDDGQNYQQASQKSEQATLNKFFSSKQTQKREVSSNVVEILKTFLSKQEILAVKKVLVVFQKDKNYSNLGRQIVEACGHNKQKARNTIQTLSQKSSSTEQLKYQEALKSIDDKIAS